MLGSLWRVDKFIVLLVIQSQSSAVRTIAVFTLTPCWFIVGIISQLTSLCLAFDC